MRKKLIVMCMALLTIQINGLAQVFNQPAGVLTHMVANPFDANSIGASYRGFGDFEGAPKWLEVEADVLLTDQLVSGLSYKQYSVGYYRDSEVGLSSVYTFPINKNWKVSAGIGLDWLSGKMDFARMLQDYPMADIPLENEYFTGLQVRYGALMHSQRWFLGLTVKQFLGDFTQDASNIADIDDHQQYLIDMLVGRKFTLVPTVLDLQAYVGTSVPTFDVFKDPKAMPLHGGISLNMYEVIDVGVFGKYPEGAGLLLQVQNKKITINYRYFMHLQIGASPQFAAHTIGIRWTLGDREKPLMRISNSTYKNKRNI